MTTTFQIDLGFANVSELKFFLMCEIVFKLFLIFFFLLLFFNNYCMRLFFCNFLLYNFQNCTITWINYPDSTIETLMFSLNYYKNKTTY